jgi:hypothetical protein
MRRVLTFEPTPQGQSFARLAYNGFVVGGNKLMEQSQGRRAREERRTGGEVLKKLKGLWSDPKDVDNPDKPARGGTVNLSQPEHELLFKYLDVCPWHTQELDQATELVDFVMAAREEQEEKSKP